MARDSDALKVRKWAATSSLVQTPEAAGLTRATGLPASYGTTDFLALEVFNQLWREITGAAVEVGQHGLLPWHTGQSYPHDPISLVIGSDGELYKSVQASGGSLTSQDPTTDTSDTYWEAFAISVANSSTTARGIIRTATAAEARTGTATSPAVTPAGLTAAIAAAAPTGPGELLFTVSASDVWPWSASNGRVVVGFSGGSVGFESIRDIDLGNGSWEGGVSDGTTIWFVDDGADMAVAYVAATGVRDSTKDINLGGGSWAGGVSDGTTIWFIESSFTKAVAYVAATRVRDSTKDITLGSGIWQGGVSDGTTIWFVSNNNMAVAYVAATRVRDSTKDIDLGNGSWAGGVSDGTTIWFIDSPMAVAYVAATGVRDSTKDITLGGGSWAGGVSDGTTIWFIDDGADMAVAYVLVISTFTVDGTTYGADTDHQSISGLSVGDSISAVIRNTGDYALVYPVY